MLCNILFERHIGHHRVQSNMAYITGCVIMRCIAYNFYGITPRQFAEGALSLAASVRLSVRPSVRPSVGQSLSTR